MGKCIDNKRCFIDYFTNSSLERARGVVFVHSDNNLVCQYRKAVAWEVSTDFTTRFAGKSNFL
jgi:hypothetical protein